MTIKPHYMDTSLHGTPLRDCFLQWPQNTLLWSHPAMAPPDTADPADPITALTAALPWNSFWTSHRSRSWPHPSTGTPWSNMMISSCFTNQWKFGSPFRIFQQKEPQELDPMQDPTQLDWNMCSIFWATLATGSLTIGSQLAQLMRFQRRKSKLQPSWTTCPLMMDHAVSQCCRIYQLEDVHIWPRESPDELINCLRALADRCNFPSDEEKEWNIQYRLVRALNDKELIKKLLTLDLKATTPKMLKVCQTHIAISDNLEAMGLKEKKTVNAIRKQNKPHQGRKPPVDSVHSCGHCTKSHPPGWSSCPSTGWHMPWMWKERTLEAQVLKWT